MELELLMDLAEVVDEGCVVRPGEFGSLERGDVAVDSSVQKRGREQSDIHGDVSKLVGPQETISSLLEARQFSDELGPLVDSQEVQVREIYNTSISTVQRKSKNETHDRTSVDP